MINYFKSEKITDSTCRVVGLDGTACYLVCGKDKTCLIDTGMGCGSLKEYIENNLNKKVDLVILTHGHLDHCGGVAEFVDVPIYMNQNDKHLADCFNLVESRYEIFRSQGIDISMMQPNIDFSITKDLKDKDEFNLGGITLQAIYTPGHTKGMTMILIKEERTILFGDGCGVGVLMFTPDSTSVEEYKDVLVNLKNNYEDKYDKIIRNHGTFKSEKDLLDNVIECCELIIDRKDDKADVYDALPVNNPKGIYYAKAIDPKTHNRLDGKFGNIAYSEDKIFKKK